jgi:NAD(P)-dependent dehydrogenase (short-subunit alcohol dehydrogenase family)
MAHASANSADAAGGLAGTVALVTGGGRGLGKHYAGVLAAAGASVAVTARTEKDLVATVSEIESAGGRALAVPADVTDRVAVEQAVAEAERRFGPIDLLVNNAGRFQALGALWEVDPDDWWREHEVNVRGPVLCASAVLPGMLERASGRILNAASGASTATLPGASAYSASKTALVRWTDTLARELDGTGVSVFAIDPGTVDTPMNQQVLRTHAEGFARWAPWFPAIFAEGRAESLEPAGRLVLAIAGGFADALSGRFLSVHDDLDELIRRAEEIRRDDLLVLRLKTEP